MRRETAKEKPLIYTVVLERNEGGGYTVTVPALKGCVTQGRNIADALSRAKEAIECHIEALVSLGKRIPADKKCVQLNVEDAEEVLVFKVTVSPEAEPKKAGVSVA